MNHETYDVETSFGTVKVRPLTREKLFACTSDGGVITINRVNYHLRSLHVEYVTRTGGAEWRTTWDGCHMRKADRAWPANEPTAKASQAVRVQLVEELGRWASEHEVEMLTGELVTLLNDQEREANMAAACRDKAKEHELKAWDIGNVSYGLQTKIMDLKAQRGSSREPAGESTGDSATAAPGDAR